MLQLRHHVSRAQHGVQHAMGPEFATGVVSQCRQLPAAKVARRWRFANSPKKVYQQGSPQVLPAARVADLARLLSGRGFQVSIAPVEHSSCRG